MRPTHYGFTLRLAGWLILAGGLGMIIGTLLVLEGII